MKNAFAIIAALAWLVNVSPLSAAPFPPAPSFVTTGAVTTGAVTTGVATATSCHCCCSGGECGCCGNDPTSAVTAESGSTDPDSDPTLAAGPCLCASPGEVPVPTPAPVTVSKVDPSTALSAARAIESGSDPPAAATDFARDDSLRSHGGPPPPPPSRAPPI